MALFDLMIRPVKGSNIKDGSGDFSKAPLMISVLNSLISAVLLRFPDRSFIFKIHIFLSKEVVSYPGEQGVSC